MKRLILWIFISSVAWGPLGCTELALTGCGPISRFSNDLNGNLTPYCFHGVTYLALGEHALVRAWDRDGKPMQCTP